MDARLTFMATVRREYGLVAARICATLEIPVRLRRIRWEDGTSKVKIRPRPERPVGLAQDLYR